MKVPREEIISILQDMEDSGIPQFFSIVVRYRDNKENRRKNRVGKLREFNCAMNVTGYESGGDYKYFPRDKDLFWVCDMGIVNANREKPKNERPNPYRSIAYEGIVRVKTGGEVYEVEE